MWFSVETESRRANEITLKMLVLATAIASDILDF